MIINFNGTCSSHAPILLEYLHTFKPKKIVEFGSGYFSTQMLIDSAAAVHSFEISSKDWYNFLINRYKQTNWKYTYETDIRNIEKAIDNMGEIDLAFVDDGDSRAPLTNYSFDKANTIIAHDTQCDWAKDFKVPSNYMRIDFTQTPHHYESPKHRPFTTLMTKDSLVYNYFIKTGELSLYEKYKFPYGITR